MRHNAAESFLTDESLSPATCRNFDHADYRSLVTHEKNQQWEDAGALRGVVIGLLISIVLWSVLIGAILYF